MEAIESASREEPSLLLDRQYKWEFATGTKAVHLIGCHSLAKRGATAAPPAEFIP